VRLYVLSKFVSSTVFYTDYFTFCSIIFYTIGWFDSSTTLRFRAVNRCYMFCESTTYILRFFKLGCFKAGDVSSAQADSKMLCRLELLWRSVV